jgi:beta-galactosidase
VVEFKLPTIADLDGISNLFMKVDYTGDVARLSAKTRLLTDNFYNGTPWFAGLKRFSKELSSGPLELSILPLRKDAPIFLEDLLRPVFTANGQIDELRSFTFIPQYRLVINVDKRP